MSKIPRIVRIFVLLIPFNALAHHSLMPYDTSAVLSIEGTVTEYVWKNPHVFLLVDRNMADGSVTAVEIEADAAAALIPFGTSAESVSVGDRVVVNASPHRRLGAKAMLGREIIKDDGTIVTLSISYSRQLVSSGSAIASSIEGTWLPEQLALFRFNEEPELVPVTEAGRRAIEEYSLSDSPFVSCIPPPAPVSMLYPALNTVEIRDNLIVLRNDWLGEDRIVYMDGRGHPENTERTIQGHSIGWWEGLTLVIDTMHFADHRRGHVGLGLPSGPRKHLIERITLNEDGTSLTYTFTAEDPDYLAEPITYSFVWYYRPDMRPTRIECDFDSAGRALELESEG